VISARCSSTTALPHPAQAIGQSLSDPPGPKGLAVARGPVRGSRGQVPRRKCWGAGGAIPCARLT
jgi:hypothetical protein